MTTKQSSDRGRPGAFYRGVERLSSAAGSLAGWAYAAITALVCFDIVARRLLGFSTGATAELTGYLMAAGMTLGLAGALFERAHVRIDVLLQRLPLRIRLLLHGISLAGLLTSTGFLAWGAVNLTVDSYQLGAADLSALHLPLVVPQGVWAAGFALLFLAVVAISCRAIRLAMIGAESAADALLLPRNDIDEAEDTLEALGKHGEAVKLAASRHAELVDGSSK